VSVTEFLSKPSQQAVDDRVGKPIFFIVYRLSIKHLFYPGVIQGVGCIIQFLILFSPDRIISSKANLYFSQIIPKYKYNLRSSTMKKSLKAKSAVAGYSTGRCTKIILPNLR